ncbi:MAG: hypothetical protein ACLP0J_17740 [Solirubrobacteraceae bacterium]|jgi:hypothetical protein
METEDHQHRHSEIWLLARAAVHHGHAEQTHAARSVVLGAAHEATLMRAAEKFDYHLSGRHRVASRCRLRRRG